MENQLVELPVFVIAMVPYAIGLFFWLKIGQGKSVHKWATGALLAVWLAASFYVSLVNVIPGVAVMGNSTLSKVLFFGMVTVVVYWIWRLQYKLDDSNEQLQEAVEVSRKLMEYLRFQDKGEGLAATSQFQQKLNKALHEMDDILELTIESLSKSMHMSVATLTRHIKKELDTSPGQFIKQFKLSRAHTLYERGGYATLSSLALAAGYRDPNHFHKEFKQFRSTIGELEARLE